MSMFIQYFPYNAEGADTPAAYNAAREKFADRCFDILNEYAPNFKNVRDRSAGAVAARH